MKKKLFLLAIVACAFLPASAGINWGVEAGLNINKLSFSTDIVAAENRAGFYLGPKIHAKIPVLGLGFDAAVHYANKSAAADYVEGTETKTDTKTLNYLEIPLNVRWDFDLKVVGLYVATGPQFTWQIGNLSWDLPDTYHSIDFERTTYYWNVGAGVMLFDHLAIGVNYNIPLNRQSVSSYTDLISTNPTEIVSDVKDGSWQIYLNYFF